MDNIRHILWNVMMDVIYLGQSNELERWLAVFKSSPKSLNALLPIAVHASQPKIVEMLCNKGASVNLQGEYGDTLFGMAVQLGHLEVAKILLNKSKDMLNKANKGGVTPLESAAINEDAQMMYWLIEQGADFEQKTVSGIGLLNILINTENNVFIAGEKEKISNAKEKIALRKAEIEAKGSANRQYLLSRFEKLDVLLTQFSRNANQQKLLYDVIGLSEPKSDPEEWLDLLKYYVGYFFKQGAQLDHKALSLIIKSGMPLLDVIPKPESVVNVFKSEADESYLDILVMDLEQLIREEKNFTASKSYAWRTATIIQTIQCGALLNRLTWNAVLDVMKSVRDHDWLAIQPQIESVLRPCGDQLPTPPSSQDAEANPLSTRPGL